MRYVEIRLSTPEKYAEWLTCLSLAMREALATNPTPGSILRREIDASALGRRADMLYRELLQRVPEPADPSAGPKPVAEPTAEVAEPTYMIPNAPRAPAWIWNAIATMSKTLDPARADIIESAMSTIAQQIWEQAWCAGWKGVFSDGEERPASGK